MWRTSLTCIGTSCFYSRSIYWNMRIEFKETTYTVSLTCKMSCGSLHESSKKTRCLALEWNSNRWFEGNMCRWTSRNGLRNDREEVLISEYVEQKQINVCLGMMENLLNRNHTSWSTQRPMSNYTNVKKKWLNYGLDFKTKFQSPPSCSYEGRCPPL